MKIALFSLYKQVSGVSAHMDRDHMKMIMTWHRQHASDNDGDDELNGTSKWPMNTFLGAPEVLYGVMRLDSVVVGRVLSGVEGDAVEVDKVWVSPEYRRQGVATRMLQEGMQHAGVGNAYAPNLTEDGNAWWQYVAPDVENSETDFAP